MVLWKVFIITIGFQTVLNLTRPVITLYASDMGASTFEIGILTASYAFFPMIFAIKAGKIANAIGDRIPILFGSLGNIASMLIPYFFPSMWSLFISQLLMGTSNVFITVSAQNVLGNSANASNRDHYFSMLTMAVSSGALIGPVIGGYITEHFSYSTAFFVSIFISFIPFVFSFWIPNIVRGNKQENNSILTSLKLVKIPKLRSALFSSALVLYSRDIFVAYFPLFAHNHGVSKSTIGWILAIQGLAMIIVRFFLPKLLEIFSREKVLLLSIVMAGLAFLLIPVTKSILLTCLLSSLMGFGLGSGQPLSMTTIYNASPKSRTGEVLGLRLTTNRLSQLMAPLFFGVVGNWIGIISVFLISGAFLIGGTFFIGDGKEKNPYNESNVTGTKSG